MLLEHSPHTSNTSSRLLTVQSMESPLCIPQAPADNALSVPAGLSIRYRVSMYHRSCFGEQWWLEESMLRGNHPSLAA